MQFTALKKNRIIFFTHTVKCLRKLIFLENFISDKLVEFFVCQLHFGIIQYSINHPY